MVGKVRRRKSPITIRVEDDECEEIITYPVVYVTESTNKKQLYKSKSKITVKKPTVVKNGSRRKSSPLGSEEEESVMRVNTVRNCLNKIINYVDSSDSDQNNSETIKNGESSDSEVQIIEPSALGLNEIEPNTRMASSTRSKTKTTPGKDRRYMESSRRDKSRVKSKSQIEDSDSDQNNSEMIKNRESCDSEVEIIEPSTLGLNEIEPNTRMANNTRSKTKTTPGKDGRYMESTRRDKSRVKSKSQIEDSDSEQENKDILGSQDESFEDGIDILKPTALFEPDDIAGNEMFCFPTPKKKTGMAMKASAVTPKTPVNKAIGVLKNANSVTPQSARRKLSTVTENSNTPYGLRVRMKQKLTSMRWKEENDGDFSASQSEYSPSDSESSSDNEPTQSSDEENEPVQKPKPSIVPRQQVQPPNTRNRAKKDLSYEFQSDGYFSLHSSNKNATSDHTLDRLKASRLPQDHLQSILKSMTISEVHQHSIADLCTEYSSLFPKWMYILNEGYSLLLYGLGSKMAILQKFHSEMLPGQHVLVVNGFFPSLTIKDILDSITVDILELSPNLGNAHEVVDVIDKEMNGFPEMHLFIIVHNIDGAVLRNSICQNVLSRLAKIKNIHLLASMDHINTPLIWDHTKLSNFNFSWWDVTSMLPYADETSFENSLMGHNSGALALSSLKNVFQSLTSNSKGIYLLIVKNQLDNKSNTTYQGMPFKDLYSGCRDVFLVSSDLALRAQLTEFLDHKLVKSRRTADGTERLTIPIENSLLQQFLDDQ